MIKEGTHGEGKDPLKVSSGPMTRKKAKELSSALQAFVSSFFMENGHETSQGAAGTFKTPYGDDGYAWYSVLECLDKSQNKDTKDTTQSAPFEPP